jgi:hypothetical protein
LERSLGSTCRVDDLSSVLTTASELLCGKALVRLLPRIGPPSVAECDSMACSELCRRRQNTASGPRTEQQIVRRKDWISIANRASLSTLERPTVGRTLLRGQLGIAHRTNYRVLVDSSIRRTAWLPAL